MHKGTFDWIVADPLVYYVYQVDLSVFCNKKQKFKEYIVITSPKFKPNFIESDDIKEDDVVVRFYTTTEWFQRVLDNDILAWICACLNKKYIIKEAVKLIIPFDALKVRKSVDSYLSKTSHDLDAYYFWEILLCVKLANQIIESHKIVRYKETADAYDTLNAMSDEELQKNFPEMFKQPWEQLLKYTESLRKKAIIDNIKKNNKE